MEIDERASILPAGTVTYLLAASEPGGPPENAAELLERRRRLVQSVVEAHGGLQPDDADGTGPAGAPKTLGDEVLAVFASATAAVAAALDIQRLLNAEHRPGDGIALPPLRIGLHTGEALLRDDRYYTGPALHRCARLRDLAHGGQTLLSAVTAELVADALPDGTWLEDLGAHRLRDLSRPERVSELRHLALPDAFPPLMSLDVLANNLPVQLTTFVGRGDELVSVEMLLVSERLVTLTGSGGCGKTRLALQAAADLADRWPDGVWWVDLGPVSDPDQVARLVASAIGVLVEPVGGPLRALTLQLRDRRLLVCLDNCEHVLEACAEVTEALLLACPEVSVLTTSREPLGLPGETVWRVPSLGEEEAVALFAERASRVRPWFTLDATSEDAVRTLCRRLDGIPLAIELAAAWLRVLTPAQIAAGLDDRFALLVRGPRGAIARQQTLAASIDWSHDLLDATDRVVFRRLAVFAGSFTLAAARAACAATPVAESEVLPALARLVDKSLVVVDEGEDEPEAEARYRLLETIRQYASDRLEAADELAATRDRHLDHYLAVAEAAVPELEGPHQDAWLVRQEREHDNLRAALDWGLQAPDPERSRRLAAALFWLWYRRGLAKEGMEYLQRAIDRAPDDRSYLQAELLDCMAAVAQAGGRFPLVAEFAQRGLELATANGDDLHRGRCLFLLAFVQFYLDLDAAQELCAQARQAAQAVGDAFVADGILVHEGSIASTRDQHEAARPLLQEGAARCRTRGDRTFAALALNYQDDAAVRTGDLQLADELATEALRIAQPLRDYYAVGLATCHLALAKGIAGDIDGGLRLMSPVVRSVEGSAHDAYVPRLAPVMGKLCLWRGDLEAAAAWFERDAHGGGATADSLIAARSLPGLGAALRLLGRHDEAADQLERAVAVARRLGVPHLLADALEQTAHLAAADDHPEQAEELHHQALGIRVEHELRTFYVDSLDALVALTAANGNLAEAARLGAASDAARRAMGYPRPPIDQPGHAAMRARLREGLDDDEQADLEAEGAALSLDDAVAYARRARGSRGRPSTGWASLTPTERDVVRLVAEGLTNPQIGERLFMSRATVKTHLSHIYAKLGVVNRTELASLASQHQA